MALSEDWTESCAPDGEPNRNLHREPDELALAVPRYSESIESAFGSARKRGAKDLAERSDLELVEGIQRADEVCFNLLYERYYRRVYGLARTRLRNASDAEEVVQDTFTAVFRFIDSYRGQSSLLSWIYGIAKNTVNNYVRRARAHEARLERAELEMDRSEHSMAFCTPEQSLDLRRCVQALQDQLDAMPSWHAEIFVMRHLEGMPIDEIASVTDRSNDSVRSSLYRVKRLLVGAAESGLVTSAAR